MSSEKESDQQSEAPVQYTSSVWMFVGLAIIVAIVLAIGYLT
jgi:hypothetical protein